MTLDEAIKHCEEVAENNEIGAEWHNATNELKQRCLECAAEHRQLAEWLTELRQWRRVYGVCPSYEMCIPECKEGYNAQIKEIEAKHWDECRQIAHYEDELRKAKELLKKLENTIDDLCDDVSDSPCGCDCCSYVDTINEDEGCEVHRLRAGALKLIGGEANEQK